MTNDKASCAAVSSSKTVNEVMMQLVLHLWKNNAKIIHAKKTSDMLPFITDILYKHSQVLMCLAADTCEHYKTQSG